MTEEEAKTKLVCKREIVITSTFYCHGSGHTEYNYGEERLMCIGSECAVWTWAEAEYAYSGGKVDDSGWEETTNGLWRKKRDHREGYCGIGGCK